jgi:hypothetical protein
VKRIRAIEPGFDPAELKAIRERMQRHSQAKLAAARAACRWTRTRSSSRSASLGPRRC